MPRRRPPCIFLGRARRCGLRPRRHPTASASASRGRARQLRATLRHRCRSRALPMRPTQRRASSESRQVGLACCTGQWHEVHVRERGAHGSCGSGHTLVWRAFFCHSPVLHAGLLVRSRNHLSVAPSGAQSIARSWWIRGSRHCLAPRRQRAGLLVCSRLPDHPGVLLYNRMLNSGSHGVSSARFRRFRGPSMTRLHCHRLACSSRETETAAGTTGQRHAVHTSNHVCWMLHLL